MDKRLDLDAMDTEELLVKVLKVLNEERTMRVGDEESAVVDTQTRSARRLRFMRPRFTNNDSVREFILEMGRTIMACDPSASDLSSDFTFLAHNYGLASGTSNATTDATRRELDNANREIDRLRSEVGRLEEVRASALVEYTELLSRTTVNAERDAELVESKRILEQLNATLERYRTGEQELKDQLDRCNEELKNRQDASTRIERDLKEQLERCRSDLDRNEQESKGLLLRNKQLQDDLEQCRAESAEQSLRLRNCLAKLERLDREHDENQRNTRMELQKTRNDLTIKDNELERFRDVLEKIQIKQKNLYDELEQCQAESRINRANSEQELRISRANSEQCQAELRISRAELEQRRAEFEQCLAELKQRRAELEQCRAELEQCRAELEQCRSEVLTIRREYDKMLTVLRQYNERYQEMQAIVRDPTPVIEEVSDETQLALPALPQPELSEDLRSMQATLRLVARTLGVDVVDKRDRMSAIARACDLLDKNLDTMFEMLPCDRKYPRMESFQDCLAVIQKHLEDSNTEIESIMTKCAKDKASLKNEFNNDMEKLKDDHASTERMLRSRLDAQSTVVTDQHRMFQPLTQLLNLVQTVTGKAQTFANESEINTVNVEEATRNLNKVPATLEFLQEIVDTLDDCGVEVRIELAVDDREERVGYLNRIASLCQMRDDPQDLATSLMTLTETQQPLSKKRRISENFDDNDEKKRRISENFDDNDEGESIVNLKFINSESEV